MRPTLSIRDILAHIGDAVRAEMLLLASSGRYPLRPNSELAKSIEVQVSRAQGRAPNGQFVASGELSLYALDYAIWLNRGRRPFTKKVPLSAIVQFIKNRNMVLRDRTTGRFRRSRVRLKARNGNPALSVTRLAFLIQNAIYRNGIRGRRFIEPALALGNELLDIYLNNDLLDSITLDIEKTLGLIPSS